MFKIVRSLTKSCYVLPLFALILLSGCGSQATQTAQAPQPTQAPQATQAPQPTQTPQPTQAPKPTQAPQPTQAPTPKPSNFTAYVGKWQVHGSQLSINADHSGLELWNVGPCSDTQMCNGNAKITFTENADGSIKGAIQSVSYTTWDGNPAPTGYQPDPTDPRAGDTFQLQHNAAHLLYTTWFGTRLSSLNSGNRYWCDAYASKAGWKQCGA